MHAHRAALRVEAGGQSGDGRAGERRRDHALHPLVIGRHRLAADLHGPARLGGEGEALRRRQRPEIVALVEAGERVMPERARLRGGGDVIGRQLQPVLDLVDRRLRQFRAGVGVLVERQQRGVVPVA